MWSNINSRIFKHRIWKNCQNITFSQTHFSELTNVWRLPWLSHVLNDSTLNINPPTSSINAHCFESFICRLPSLMGLWFHLGSQGRRLRPLCWPQLILPLFSHVKFKLPCMASKLSATSLQLRLISRQIWSGRTPFRANKSHNKRWTQQSNNSNTGESKGASYV